MARKKGEKKSFQQSLDDIKEKMKEKRNKRLARASAPRGRSLKINKTNASNSNSAILNGIQQNNKSLALAVQAEKEKVRQANCVILQLKREQQALFLHLLLLKRRLKEQEDMAKKSDSSSIAAASKHLLESSRQTRITSGKPPMPEEAPSPSQGPPAPEETGESDREARFIALPSTVGVRRRRAVSCTRRDSEQTRRRRSFSDTAGPVDATAEAGLLTASPIQSDCGAPKRRSTRPRRMTGGPVNPPASEHTQQSTPEPAPAKSTNQLQPRRKPAQQQQQQQPRVKEPATCKPERGRKVERGPLKKPWEKTKPSRARSKSRDRSATRGRPPAPQADKLNTSLGFNDTFDFDCEEAVHLTPFKAKAEGGEAAPEQEAPMEPAPTTPPGSGPAAASPPPSSPESEGELYVPRRGRRRPSSPETGRVLPGRRGRRATSMVRKQQEVSVFRDEDTENTAVVQESEAPPCPKTPDWMFSSSPAPQTANQESPSAPCRQELQQAAVLVVTPGMEAEMMRIDSVLSSFRDSSSSDMAPHVLPSKPPRKTAKVCKKRGFGVRAAGRGLSLCDVTNMSSAAYFKVPSAGSHPSEERCSTPIIRKRRCTMAVDYKEPSLNSKLRRGDKHTDLQFLRSPVFKNSPRARRRVAGPRLSVQGSGTASRKSQQLLDKYNESFVGCR